jgi:hypothetical protein
MAHYNTVLRLRRQPPASLSGSPENTASRADEDSPGLLVSPAFWIGGALSVAAWAGIARLFGLF